MYKTFVVNEKDSLVMRTGTDGFQPKFIVNDCLGYSYLEPFGEDPFDLANMLLNYQPFNKYLNLKKKYGKLSINKNIFPNDLAYEYYKK